MFFSFCCSVTKWCLTLWDPMDCSTPGFPVTHHLMSRVSDAIQPAHPLPSASPPALNLSQQWSLFQWVALHVMWRKYWSFSISPSNKYSGLISFRIDWLDLLAVEGTLKSSPAPQFESIRALMFSLYGPTLTSVHDYWTTSLWLDRSLLAKWCLCFLICCLGWS